MKNVLIIDDSDFMRSRLKEIIEEIGKKLIGEAIDGKQGVEMYKELKPDLVFLDINMPELSGRDALIQIMDHDPDANIIMCSTLGSEDIVAECIEEGAHFYILKPFVRDNVKQVIEDLENALAG